MFFKYASNILQEISDECMLKAFSCSNTEDAKLYKKIAERIDSIVTIIGADSDKKVK